MIFVVNSGTSLSQAQIDALDSLVALGTTPGGSAITKDGSGNFVNTVIGGGGSGTVTSVSVVSANGFAGTVATATTTPAITISTTITGILQGNGTSISAATTTGSGSVVLATSPTLVTPALGTPSAIVLTNATGLPISGLTGLGTGVATALAVNVGSAGAFVTFNGALGTPSSGTVTNLTGTASININGTVGATTPNTGAFTTLSASSTLTASTTIELGNASDTTLSRVSAGVMAVEGVRVITSAGTTANTILKNNGTTFVASTETYAAPGTVGNVMTSDGTNWTSAAPTGGSTTSVLRSTCFEDIGRFTETNTGGGNTTFGAQGIEQGTSATGTSSTSITWNVDASNNIFLGSPTATISLYCGNFGDTSNTRSSFYGIGTVTVNGSGHTYTVAHAGFKILLSGGVYSLYATQANGTTETASAALTTITTGDILDLIIKINSTTSIDYYWRKNGGSLSSATNLTTNMPTASNGSVMQFSGSNNANANFMTTLVQSASYER